MYRYDIAPGELVETEDPIDENQLADARERLERGQALSAIAKLLGGKVFKPDTDPVARVAVDQAELERLLASAYPDEADRARVLAQLSGRSARG